MYTEILKLKSLLEKADIPFEFSSHDLDPNGYHLYYPEKNDFTLSAIQAKFSYGHTQDLIEIMGLCGEDDDVEGSLTAEEVYTRIVEHYKAHSNYKERVN